MIDLVITHLTHPWGPPGTLETLGDPWRPCLKMGKMTKMTIDGTPDTPGSGNNHHHRVIHCVLSLRLGKWQPQGLILTTALFLLIPTHLSLSSDRIIKNMIYSVVSQSQTSEGIGTLLGYPSSYCQFGERVGHGGWLIGPKLFRPKACVSSKLCEFIS